MSQKPKCFSNVKSQPVDYANNLRALDDFETSWKMASWLESWFGKDEKYVISGW